MVLSPIYLEHTFNWLSLSAMLDLCGVGAHVEVVDRKFFDFVKRSVNNVKPDI